MTWGWYRPRAPYGPMKRRELLNEAALISGLENPNSLSQLKPWISAEMGADSPATLRKDDVKDLLANGKTPDCARRMLEIRQLLGKTSVSKYDALAAQAQGGNRAVGCCNSTAHTRAAGAGAAFRCTICPNRLCAAISWIMRAAYCGWAKLIRTGRGRR